MKAAVEFSEGGFNVSFTSDNQECIITLSTSGHDGGYSRIHSWKGRELNVHFAAELNPMSSGCLLLRLV